MDRPPTRTRAICLIGIDGSGKTAHACAVLSELTHVGRKCKYMWFGGSYFFSYPFMEFCRALDLTDIHPLRPGTNCSEHRYYRNRAVAWVWPWIRFLDLAVFVVLHLYVSIWRGFLVVCDRFVHDILVELMVDSLDETLPKKLIGRLILRLEPNSTAVLLLDVDEKVAFRRKHDIHNLDYLIVRRQYYRSIAHDLRIPMLDAERPFGLVQKEVFKHLACPDRFQRPAD